MPGGGLTTNIILGVIVIAIIIFAVVSSVMGKKSQRLERERRKKQVKEEIKRYIKETDNRKNLRIEYEKVIARKGKEYKFRDVFDVIVNIYEAKKNKFLEQKAYEIEGVSKKISKKDYQTTWHVNQEINLQDTIHRIEVSEKKIKLSKTEKKALKIQADEQFKAEKALMIKKRQEEKIQKKQGTKIVDKEKPPRPKADKFAPRK